MNDDQWSKAVAVIVADSLVDGGLLDRAQIPRASEIIAEEIWVRLLCEDYPPGATDPNKRAVAHQEHPGLSAG